MSRSEWNRTLNHGLRIVSSAVACDVRKDVVCRDSDGGSPFGLVGASLSRIRSAKKPESIVAIQ